MIKATKFRRSCVLSLSLLLVILGVAVAGEHESWHDLFPVDQNGKWGFIDAKGRIVIRPTFEQVSYFSEGLAAVKMNGQYGFIDKTGKMVITPRFRYAFDFSEGLAWVEGGPTGFIDKTGKIVLSAPGSTYCREFRDGLALTKPLLPRFDEDEPPTPTRRKYEPKVGFIDKTGNYAVKPQFNAAWDFAEGLAAVKIDEKWGFVDEKGQFVIQPQYDSASYFSEELAAVEKDGKTFFINKTGKRAIATDYEDALGFREGLAAQIGGAWGFINKTGAIIIEPHFGEVSPFFNGIASIKSNHKYGYIDKSGKVIVEPKYAYGHFFLGELAGVAFEEQSDGSGTSYINREGQVVWKLKPAAIAAK
jgi:hypothetical protein